MPSKSIHSQTHHRHCNGCEIEQSEYAGTDGNLEGRASLNCGRGETFRRSQLLLASTRRSETIRLIYLHPIDVAIR